MPFTKSTTSAGGTALIYVTAGSLIVIWSGMWFAYLYNHPPRESSTYYWCTGTLITGAALFLIGIGLGRIRRAARQAEPMPAAAGPATATSPEPVQTGVSANSVCAANSPGDLSPTTAFPQATAKSPADQTRAYS